MDCVPVSILCELVEASHVHPLDLTIPPVTQRIGQGSDEEPLGDNNLDSTASRTPGSGLGLPETSS